jgi:two-component system, chemotaxis family, chemotaxis protein CheY
MPDPKRVLLAEDDQLIAVVLEDALGDEGYEVRRVTNGRQALELLTGWVPDVILLDLMMPVMDGWTFRTAQQQLPGAASQVPVVVVTGTRDAAYQARALSAAAVIMKPFDLLDVMNAVDHACHLPSLPPNPAP